MRNTRKILSFAAATLLVISACFYLVSAQENNVAWEPLEDNFTTQSGSFAIASGLLIKNDDGSTFDPGFTYTVDDFGGIRVESPVQTDDAVVATSAVTSKAKTPLDGLTVTVKPDEFDFTKDAAGRSASFSLLWTPDEPYTLDAVDHYDHTGTNGLRNMIKQNKGLAIVINNSYNKFNGTKTASNVMITLVDGDFTDACDYRIGYRWSFTARNNYEQSPNCDRTGIRQYYEEIDMTDGLTVSVRADEEHGFIVNINGTDYYESDKIAYFPNNIADQYDEASMTFQKQDIDLSCLAGLEGYITVGSCGNEIPGTSHSYTIESINGAPAADFIAAE